MGYNFPQSATGYYFEAHRFIGTVGDDNTAFETAAEIGTGDQYLIFVPLKNASNNDIVGKLTITYPDGLTVEVGDNTENVSVSARIGPYTWTFKLDAAADMTAPSTNYDDCLIIAVAASDTIVPGFYEINGKIEQISQ